MARSRAFGAALTASIVTITIACHTDGDREERSSHASASLVGAADAGRDARADSGVDAGVDARADARADAGEDAGLDAGVDATGGVDADAGYGPGGGAESHVWTALSPAQSPSTRDGFAMAYDSVRGQVVLFGGESCSNNSLYCAAATFYGDTWIWDGATWTQKFPTKSPPPRIWGELAFDRARGVAVLFGGMDANSVDLSDTWEWDGATWKKVALTGPHPDPRDQFGMTYDVARKVTVVFSGEECPPAGCPAPLGTTQLTQPDTWEWNGTIWAARTPATSPPARLAHKMIYDEGLAQTVLFGGISCFSAACPNAAVEYGDTWTWNGTTWTEVTPAASPTARDSFAMAFDPRRGKIILFGGYGASNDTWEWDRTAWTDVTSAPSPNYRFWSRLVFDENAGRGLLFGGTTDSYDLNDTWQYHARGGSCAAGATCDTGSCVDATCCETAGCGTCQSCNTAAGPGVCAAIFDAPDPPSCSGARTCDATGQCKLVVGQPCPNGNADCANGACVDGYCCNSTCTSPCAACSVALGALTNGACAPATRGYSGNPACTGGFVCDGISASCPASCVGDADCAVGSYCAANQTCQPQKDEGATCDVTAGADCLQAGCRECVSGSCADGVCCDSACTAPCEVCAQAHGASANGACTNAPHGTPGSSACAPYVCSGASPTCPSTCTAPSDCSNDAVCSAGKCVVAQRITCDGDHTVTGADGRKTDCSPYTCDATGCKTTCGSVQSCVYPFVCNESGKCIAAPAPLEGAAGCSVAAGTSGPARRRPALPVAMAFIALAAIARPRRRRRVARSCGHGG